MLYAGFTSYVYKLNDSSRQIFEQNISSLNEKLDLTPPQNKIVLKFCLKFIDHYTLANLQRQELNTLAEQISKMVKDANNLHNKVEAQSKDLQNMQEFQNKVSKDYTTILGIFSAIVVAFVANMWFSSALLNHLEHVGSFKLAFIATLIAFFFFNILFALFYFIHSIIDKAPHYIKPNKYVLIITDVILVGLMILFMYLNVCCTSW